MFMLLKTFSPHARLMVCACFLRLCFVDTVESTARASISIPRPDHVVIVMEENRSPRGVIDSIHAPYLATLADRGAVFTEYFGIAHPSQPNYFVIFSGSTQGVSDDSCPHHFGTRNLASELIDAGLTFAGYSEGLPGTGATTCESGLYVRRHAPWINFVNVSPRLHLPFSQFPSDFNQLPSLCFVIPNKNNDMHSSTTERADAWLRQHIDPYVQWAQTNNSLLIVAWDEGANPNQVALLMVGPMVQPGRYCGHLTHYNLARTLEDMFGLPYAGLTASARPITYVWSTGAPPPDVTITAPADGATFVAPIDITLSAEARSGAPIQKIEFFSGATKLGETTASPYTFLWRNAQPGISCLRAKVTDEQGGTRSSSGVTVAVTGTASNLFLTAKGAYQGEWTSTTNSGSLTLNTTPRGTFAGRLNIGGGSLPFHGRFDQTGFAELGVSRRGQLPLTLDLILDLFSPEHRIHGSIIDGTSFATLEGTHL